MPSVLLPSSLRRYLDQQDQLSVEGDTIATTLDNLAAAAPALRNCLFAADQIRSFLVISINGRDIRLLDGLATRVAADDVIRIVSSIAGG